MNLMSNNNNCQTICDARPLPAVGDSYTDPEIGDVQTIEAVSICAGGLVTLTLADGSLVDIEQRALVLVS